MISYIIRLIFQSQDESKSWMMEMQSSDPIIPTLGSHLAFNIHGRYVMFEVSMAVYYPGSDMQPVIVSKAFKASDEDLIMHIISDIKSACDGEKLIYRNTKDLKIP